MPKIFSGLFGGGQKQAKPESGAAGAAGAKKLFTPEMIAKATKDYGTQGTAKWNQIMTGMGAGGGTGGDITGAIQSQASQLGQALGGLTDQSGYGSDPTSQMQQILKSVESGFNPKYSVY